MTPPRRRRRKPSLSTSDIIDDILRKYLSADIVSCIRVGYSPDLDLYSASTLHGLPGHGKSVSEAVLDLYEKMKALDKKFN